MEGLSESWLLKELGDMHWSMITKGLGSPSSELCDGSGNRLYATFTRITTRSSSARRDRREHEPRPRWKDCALWRRHFVSDIAIAHVDAPWEARLMSNFSGAARRPIHRVKGQPTDPARLSRFLMGRRRTSCSNIASAGRNGAIRVVRDRIGSSRFTTSTVSGVVFRSYPIISDIARCDTPRILPIAARYRATSSHLPTPIPGTGWYSASTYGSSRASG